MTDKKPDNRLESSFSQHFGLAALSASMAKSATAPIDRVVLTMAYWDRHRPRDKYPLKLIDFMNYSVRVYAEQGISFFWRGNLTNVILYFPNHALNFAFYERFKAVLPKRNSKDEVGKFSCINLIAGGLAGAMSLTMIYPLETARTLLVSDVGQNRRTYTGLWDCLLKTAKNDGLLGLYQGVVPSLFSNVAFRAAYFGIFDLLKALNPYRSENSVLGVSSLFFIAQSTTIATRFVSYPFDVIRTELLKDKNMIPKNEPLLYNGWIDCLRKVTKLGGVKVLFQGVSMRLYQTICPALVLVFFDLSKRVMS